MKLLKILTILALVALFSYFFYKAIDIFNKTRIDREIERETLEIYYKNKYCPETPDLPDCQNFVTSELKGYVYNEFGGIR